MRVTVVRKDGYVAVDGEGFAPIDMQSIPENIHAIQWADGVGEVEFVVGEDGIKPPNQPMSSLNMCNTVIELWGLAKQETVVEVDETQQALDNCRHIAKHLLETSDWTQTGDVVQLLLNKSEFDTYRTTLRGLFFTPVVEPTFPESPNPVWKDIK